MTRTEDRNVVAEVLELLIERGFEGMAQAIQILLNEAMKLEREEFFGACLHERTAERRGHANGYKPKKLRSRLGELGLEIHNPPGPASAGRWTTSFPTPQMCPLYAKPFSN